MESIPAVCVLGGLEWSIGKFCEDPDTLCPGLCPGLCANPDVAGIGTRVSIFIQAISTTLSIIWLEDPKQARMVFAIQYLSAMAFLISGISFGMNQQITNYHAILITYLAEGCAANSVIGLICGLFPDGKLATFNLVLIWAYGALIFWLSLDTRSAKFGSQPACNALVVRPTAHHVIWAGCVLLLFLPLLWRRIKSCRRCNDTANKEPDLHQKTSPNEAIALTVLSIPFYSYWMYSIHTYTRQHTILGDAEHAFSQGQVSSIAFAILSLVPVVISVLEKVFKPEPELPLRNEPLLRPFILRSPGRY